MVGWLGACSSALRAAPGTRVTFQLPPLGARSVADLVAIGFSFSRRSVRGPPAFATPDDPAASSSPSEWWSAGARRSQIPAFSLDLDVAESLMDPRDRGEMTDDPARKRMRAYLPVD
jgi:hypothetical protein